MVDPLSNQGHGNIKYWEILDTYPCTKKLSQYVIFIFFALINVLDMDRQRGFLDKITLKIQEFLSLRIFWVD